MGINKVVYGNTTLIDLTDSTLASADQLPQGITAYDRTGTKITGTATGGGAGAVIQDENGGLHFLEDGVNAFSDAITTLPNGGLHHVITGVMASGGLEYEEGTWTPSEDTNYPTITFTNSHTDAPILAMISDVSSGLVPASSFYACGIFNWYQYTGVAPNSMYAFYARRYTNSSGTATGTSGNINVESNIANYVTNEVYHPVLSNTTEYFRTSRTYKWIAVWAPTT